MENEFKTTEDLLKRAGQSVHLSVNEKVNARAQLVRRISAPVVTPKWRRLSYFNVVRFAVAPLLIVFLVGGGVTISSADTLPGDFLYTVKTGVYEPVRGLANFGVEKQLAYEQGLAERRLSEMVELGVKGGLDKDTEVDLLARFDRHRQKVEAKAERISIGEKITVQSDVESTLRAHERIFADLNREDLRKEIQSKIILAVSRRAKTESELGVTDKDLEDIAGEKQKEALQIVATSQGQREDSNETRASMQRQVQIDLAEQEIEEAGQSVEAGSFAKAIVQYEKAKRLAHEADIIFSIKDKYALVSKPVSTESVALLEEKTRAPLVDTLSLGEETEVATSAEAVVGSISIAMSLKTEINLYEYFESQLVDRAGNQATPQVYINIYHGLVAEDFAGVISNGGVYGVVSGEIVFTETVDLDDGIDKQNIELEGYVRLLINIATRLKTELISPESVDIIMKSINTQVSDESVEGV